MPWFYYVCRLILNILLPLLTRWQVKGKENIPEQGGFLLVANHLNMADPPVIALSTKRRVIFMAKEELFHSKLLGYLVGGLGSFPVHRGQLDRKALRQAQNVLAKGWALGIFPEATRSKNAQLQSGFPGSALLAVRSGVPLLPAGIAGTEKIKGFTWLLHRPKITVSFGAPFHLPPVNGKLTKEELDKFTSAIMDHIAKLLPEKYRETARLR